MSKRQLMSEKQAIRLKILTTLICIFLLFPHSSLITHHSSLLSPLRAEAGINFQNMELRDFIDFVSEYTGIHIVYNPHDIIGTVTIRAKKDFTEAEIMEMFFTVLYLNNLESMIENDIIYITSQPRAPRFPFIHKETVEDIRVADEGRQVVTVIQLENIDVNVVIGFLNLLRSETGRVVAIGAINAVAVKDRARYVRKISDVLETLILMGEGVTIEVIPLRYATATEFLGTVRAFFGELAAVRHQRVRPVFMADRISNSLIVAALPEDIATVKRIVSETDVLLEATVTTGVFELKYAKAEDMQRVLNTLFPAMKAGHGGGGAEKTIAIAADKATNTISVVADPVLYAQVKALIERLDIERHQIFVEVLILETTLEKAEKFGVEWIIGGGEEDLVGAGAFLGRDLIGFKAPLLQGQPPDIKALPEGLALSILGNMITFEGVRFPTLGALVSALRRVAEIDILSKPQLLTLDNEAAEVFVGETRPFLVGERVVDDRLIQTFEYRDVGIKLRILPHVIDEETILLNVYKEIKSVVPLADEIIAPVTLTRSTETKVKIRDNTTIVISGLMREDDRDIERRVPLLGDIPILGRLFCAEETIEEKTNLMVFITATIIRCDETIIEKLTRERRKLFEKHVPDFDRGEEETKDIQPEVPEINKIMDGEGNSYEIPEIFRIDDDEDDE
ncbi:hypothetical protein M1N62_00630 [Thermodesulfovibrionales bacterium]|nr:hypothetical protein [Thermodesulfovibrionales bacterium]